MGIGALLANVVRAFLTRKIALIGLALHDPVLDTSGTLGVMVLDQLVTLRTFELSILFEEVQLVEHEARAVDLLWCLFIVYVLTQLLVFGVEVIYVVIQ